MLKLTAVHKDFKQGDHTVNAVNGVSLSVNDGQFVSIIGQSGSGKSTLLGLIGTLDKPTSGTIEINNKDVTKLTGSELNKFRANQIGFIFQAYNLIPNLTALENVTLAMEFSGIKKAERIERARQLLVTVGLDETKQSRRPGKLSGGEQQRVAIARALSNKPDLILADEPTGNLDSETGKMIFDLMHNLAKSENTTIVVVTHDLSIAGKTEKAFRLKDGKLQK
jgi:putative ABC transport system ATP-binding protein